MPTLRLRYTYDILWETSQPVELVMEPETLLGDWSMHVNDSPALRAEQFAPTSTHVRGSLGIDITPYLMPGANQIRVELTTNRMDGGLRNPLYLAGDFAVELAPLQLVDRADAGRFDEYEANGLPHFSGVLDYAAEIDVDSVPDGEEILLELGTPMPCEDAFELSLNGGPFHPIPWSPRHVLVPASELRTGANGMRLRVRTSLIRAFEGQRFDITQHAYVDLPE
jgi:hypothetical protein